MRPSSSVVLALTLVLELSTSFPFTASALADPGRPPSHMLPALERATLLPVRSEAPMEPMTVTIVLRRADQAGFDRYLHDVYDRTAADFHAFLRPEEIADRFGPSRATYAEVLGYLERSGFALVHGATSRQTLTVRGTRAATERAFGVSIREFEADGHHFFANREEPALPPELAAKVQAVIGLNDLAVPMPANLGTFVGAINALFRTETALLLELAEAGEGITIIGAEGEVFVYSAIQLEIVLTNILAVRLASLPLARRDGARAAPLGELATGAGQKIGIPTFSNFRTTDVEDFLSVAHLPASRIDNVHAIAVNGGAALAPDQTDVLIGIQTALLITPDAEIDVYHAPYTGPGTSFQTLFQAMIDGGVTVISNTWGYCESQTTRADVESIDAILATAAAAGISVFNATGDTGSSCNGSPDTIAVPASSPHATAVGGTSPTFGPGFTYGGESWWDGTNDVPPSGQGGFGVSRFFGRPLYQDAIITGAARSVPDVVAAADPKIGPHLCEADAGGCPTLLTYGGTSLATPIWAELTAILNDAAGEPLGFLNPLLYLLAGTSGFHGPDEIGGDVAHVGLGSPNGNVLGLALAGRSPGPVSAVVSSVQAFASVPFAPFIGRVTADGTATAAIRVSLRDVNGNTVTGKTVHLAGSSGSNAVITPAGAAPTDSNGSAVFSVKDATVEEVTFTATDQSDSTVLVETSTVKFVGPPATGGQIAAFPTLVAADGVTTTTITITLEVAPGVPAVGKVVALSQGSGHSIITGPNPSVTDGTGTVQLSAVDQVNETVTYTAVDASDGNLPIPGTPQVTFNNGSGLACGNNPNPPTAEPGYLLTPFANGFVSAPLNFGNVNFGGCSGISAPAFRGAETFLLNFLNGDVFRLRADGGAASNANKLGTVGPTLGWPVIGKDGRLYASRAATTGDFTTGGVFELDRTTGAVLRTIASGFKCPSGLAIDPLSGDLFFAGTCFGAGSNDPTIHRIREPGGSNPTIEVYTTLPSSPNGNIAFAPNGSLYVVSNYLDPSALVVRVSGTDGPATPTVTALTGVSSLFWVNIGEVGSDGEARSLITLSADGKDLRLTDLTAGPPTTSTIAHNLGGGFTGPDGCLYVSVDGNVVYKLSAANGTCVFTPTSPDPSLALTPTVVQPNPIVGDSQSFTATFHGVTVKAGTEVTLAIVGANPGLVHGVSDTNGVATFSYHGIYPGTDTVLASATVGSTQVLSNRIHVTWDQGPHTTFLGNLSVTGGVVGSATTLRAVLFDLSVLPPAPVPGATATLAAGGQSCQATTDAAGVATCMITPNVLGLGSLTATFAGAAGLLPASASIGFGTVAAPIVVEECDTCVDEDGDALVDRADLQCQQRATGNGQGIGLPAARQKTLIKCQSVIGKAGDKLVKIDHAGLRKCIDRVATCVQRKPGDPQCLTKLAPKCRAALAKRTAAEEKLGAAIEKACGVKKPGQPPQLDPADLVAVTGLGFGAETDDCAARGVATLGSAHDIADCLTLQHECKVEQLISREVPRARELLKLGGIDTSALPCIESGGAANGRGLADGKRAKAVSKCQSALEQAGSAFTQQRAKRLKACVSAVASCVQLQSGDRACIEKARGKCRKQTVPLGSGEGGIAAKARARIVKACTPKDQGVNPLTDVLASDGLALDAEKSACAALGVPTFATLDQVVDCLLRHHQCRVDQLLDKQFPRAREFLSIGELTP